MGTVRMHSHLGEKTHRDESLNITVEFSNEENGEVCSLPLQGSELASDDSFCLATGSTSQTYRMETSLLHQTGSSLSLRTLKEKQGKQIVGVLT